MQLKKPALLIAILLVAISAASGQRPFSFFAIGDMPYHNPEDIGKFRKLTAAINDEKPAFTVHVGDLKNGASICSDDYFKMMLGLLNQFRAPLIYTPGDNEWTDCDRPAAGGYDPLERLSLLRKLYFHKEESLGQKPLKLTSQKHTPGYEEFVENLMWHRKGITFATAHVVGSNNNFRGVHEINEEFYQREKANIQWLTEIFEKARARKDAALVIVIHAGMNYVKSETNGYTAIVEKLRKEVKDFQKPVLLVYGDHHRFQISKPLMDADGNLIQNFTSLMVFGDSDMNAVKIDIDVRSKHVFSFSEFVMEY